MSLKEQELKDKYNSKIETASHFVKFHNVMQEWPEIISQLCSWESTSLLFRVEYPRDPKAELNLPLHLKTDLRVITTLEELPPAPLNSITIIFDLDDTLTRCTSASASSPDNMAFNVYLRPFCRETIKLLHELKIILAKKDLSLQLGIWTASCSNHARSLLEHVDPEKFFDFILCRDANDEIPNWSDPKDVKYNFKKPIELLTFPAILIDNSCTVATSFSESRPSIITIPDFVLPDSILLQIMYFLLILFDELTVSQDLNKLLLAKTRDEFAKPYPYRTDDSIVTTSWSKDHEKDIFLRVLKSHIKKSGETAYTFMLHPEYSDFITKLIKDYHTLFTVSSRTTLDAMPTTVPVIPSEEPSKPDCPPTAHLLPRARHPQHRKPPITYRYGTVKDPRFLSLPEIVAALKQDPYVFDSTPKIYFEFTPEMSQHQMYDHMVEKTYEYYYGR
ncbi:MAG: HAD family hydrolase [Gammaproteobacteria bacterium]|nr:HAD family hydrolase [Gammaproteobacteria bacterium]